MICTHYYFIHAKNNCINAVLLFFFNIISCVHYSAIQEHNINTQHTSHSTVNELKEPFSNSKSPSSNYIREHQGNNKKIQRRNCYKTWHNFPLGYTMKLCKGKTDTVLY